jgi:hypothetical protein
MERYALFDHCDACIARTEDTGWFDVLANEKGQQAMQATFAELPIKWTYTPEIGPPGWSGDCINLPKFITACPTHSLAKISLDPDGQVIAEFDYAKRLAVSLHAAGCRVIVKEGDKATDFKILRWD